ncbi:MAG: Cof-type HAD-IIB family hydrolase [Bacilli bacterium]|nr:Cof-type HAD-IIB family hydrolase [Bacilli bacterium]
MKRKLILFDVDGTLYDNKQRSVPASTILALKALKEEGHEIAVATGRAYYMLYSIDALKPYIDHYILINGQHIMAHGETIYEDTIDDYVLAKLIHSMENRGLIYGFQSSEEEAVNHLNPEVIESFHDLNLNVPPLNPSFHLSHQVYQVWCFCNATDALAIGEENPDFEFVRWIQEGYDVIKKGQSKGKALHILRDYLHYDIENVIAFGDGDNDIEMCKEAGHSVAMGNGTQRLKEAADEVTSSIDHDGIAEALRRHHLI